MSKSYKNAFYSKCLDIYTSIVYGMDGGDKGGEKEDEGDMSIRTSIYNKFIDLYGLYYKNEEFIIPITTKNIDLLSWKHEKMPITISIINNNQIKCSKFPLYNLTSIKDFIFTEPIDIKFCNDLIVIMYLGGYVNSLYAEQKMIELYNLHSLNYNLHALISL
jgi:hypothetical protein